MINTHSEVFRTFRYFFRLISLVVFSAWFSVSAQAEDIEFLPPINNASERTSDGGVAFDVSDDGSIVVGASTLEFKIILPGTSREEIRNASEPVYWVNGVLNRLPIPADHSFTATTVSANGRVIIGLVVKGIKGDPFVQPKSFY
jgi:uncharacterized membrane protein